MLGLQKDAADRKEDGGKYDEGIEAGDYIADLTGEKDTADYDTVRDGSTLS